MDSMWSWMGKEMGGKHEDNQIIDQKGEDKFILCQYIFERFWIKITSQIAAFNYFFL